MHAFSQEDDYYKYNWSTELEPAFSFSTGNEDRTDNFFAVGPLIQINRRLSNKISVHTRTGILYTERSNFQLSGYTAGLGLRWHLDSYFKRKDQTIEGPIRVYLLANYAISNLARTPATYFYETTDGRNQIFQIGLGASLRVYRRWRTKVELGYRRETRSVPNPNGVLSGTSIIYEF